MESRPPPSPTETGICGPGGRNPQPHSGCPGHHKARVGQGWSAKAGTREHGNPAAASTWAGGTLCQSGVRASAGPKWGPGCKAVGGAWVSSAHGRVTLTTQGRRRACPSGQTGASEGRGCWWAAPVGVALRARILAHSDVLTHVRTQPAVTRSLAGRRPRLSWLQPQKHPGRVCSLLAGAELNCPADPHPTGTRPGLLRWQPSEAPVLGVAGGVLLQRRGTETSQHGQEAEPRALTSSWPCPAKAMPPHPHFTGGGTEHQRGQVTFPKSHSKVEATQQIQGGLGERLETRILLSQEPG